MIDGPGPPGTDAVAVRVLPASAALMTSGSGATSGILDTQRILLLLSWSGDRDSSSLWNHQGYHLHAFEKACDEWISMSLL